MKKIIIICVFLFLTNFAQAAEETSSQQFLDFNISGYGDGGKKTWQIQGQSADIFENVVKLDNIKADMFGKEEQMQLTAKKGNLEKQSGNLHLEQDVVGTTQSGARMTTNSLDWQRNDNVVTTKDKIKIEKENMTAEGLGAKANINLNLAKMEKDVTVNINTDPKKPQGNITTIICDGPLNIDYQNEIGIFRNNVVATDAQGKIFADMMRVYFDFKSKGIKKIICVGNVKIIKGENASYSEQAIYTMADKKLLLIGRPKLVLYSEKGTSDAPFGN